MKNTFLVIIISSLFITLSQLIASENPEIQVHIDSNEVLQGEWRDVFFNNSTNLNMSNLRANPNIKNEYGTTALIWAAGAGQVAIVKELLNHPNIDINATNNSGDTALKCALETADCCPETKQIATLLKSKGGTLSGSFQPFSIITVKK
jgi:ankyrin repeat protein